MGGKKNPCSSPRGLLFSSLFLLSLPLSSQHLHGVGEGSKSSIVGGPRTPSCFLNSIHTLVISPFVNKPSLSYSVGVGHLFPGGRTLTDTQISDNKHAKTNFRICRGEFGKLPCQKKSSLRIFLYFVSFFLEKISLSHLRVYRF